MPINPKIPADAVGLRLNRIDRHGNLISCEVVVFTGGRDAVDTVLRRAKLSGRVEIGGDINDHFADIVIDENGSWTETVALDARSYASLKNKWMRCKLDTSLRSSTLIAGGRHGAL